MVFFRETPGLVRRFAGCVAVGSLLFAALPAGAATIDYEVAQGAEPQFQFSFLHAASSNCCGVPAQYLNNGAKLFRISGTLTADWDEVAGHAELLADVTLDATVLDASVPSASVGDVFQFVIKTGSFLDDTPNGRAAGELIYELFDPDDLITPVSAGIFFIFPEASFPDSANRVSASRLNVWGNNWENGIDPAPTGGFFAPLGIDMVSVPAPAPWAFLGSGLVGFLAWQRRSQGAA